MDAAGDLERGDAGGRWPEGLLRFTWSRQDGSARVYLGNHALKLTRDEAESALAELGRCVAALREWHSDEERDALGTQADSDGSGE